MTDNSARAVQLPTYSRWWLVGLGVVSSAALTAILILRPYALPDLLLAALAVFGLASFAIAIIGRLPSGFEVAGMKLDFNVDTLSDLLGTINGLSDVQEDAKTEIVRLVRRAADPAVFNEANSQYGNAKGAASREATLTASQGEETTSLEEKVRRTLASIAKSEVAENQEVQKSGIGKKPKFDFQFDAAARPGRDVSLICQIERYWNPTSVDLLRRRLDRALQQSTDVSAAIVVVPKQGRDTVKAELAEARNILLASPEEFDDEAAIEEKLRAFIRAIPESTPESD